MVIKKLVIVRKSKISELVLIFTEIYKILWFLIFFFNNSQIEFCNNLRVKLVMKKIFFLHVRNALLQEQISYVLTKLIFNVKNLGKESISFCKKTKSQILTSLGCFSISFQFSRIRCNKLNCQVLDSNSTQKAPSS